MPVPFNIDPNVLPYQARKPEGEVGRRVGETMAQRNVEPNAFTFQCLHVRPTDRVLEIGFGPGEAIAEAARLAPKGFVAGIDFSETMLTMAEERNHRAIMEERVELQLGEAAAIPYGDENFDKMFAVNVFHFWDDPSKELAECRRALRSGGRIVFFLTHPSSWFPGAAESGIFHAREAEEVAEILRHAGFRDVDHRTFPMAEGRKGFAVWGVK